MDSFERFSEDKLPDRSNFCSSLKNKCISKKYIYMLIMFGICLKSIQWVIIMILFKNRCFVVS